MVVLLRTLQSAADNQNSEATLHWRTLQQKGVPVDYDAFAARWDSQEPDDQILHKLVDRFDATGLVLKTNNGEEPARGPSGKERESEVSRMAKRATKLGK